MLREGRLNTKRRLAPREFSLGIEACTASSNARCAQFTKCGLAVLALESKPVDQHLKKSAPGAGSSWPG